VPVPAGPTGSTPKKKASPQATSPAPQKAGRKNGRELARLEGDISKREARLRELEQQLADPELYHDAHRSKDTVAEYERLRAELESLWERMSELG
jgi:hypothetical protein